MASSGKQHLSVEQVLDIIDADNSDVSLGGSSDESDSGEIYVPGNIDNIENSESESDHDKSEVNDESSGDDDGDDDNDDVPLARRLAITKKGETKTKPKYRWRKKNFEAPQCQFQGGMVEPTDPTGITETPLLYFKRFVTKEMIELIVEYTNRYSVQKNGKCVNTSAKEIEQLLGMFVKMGIVEMPAIRM
jgi:hypothetical protein